MRRSLILMLCFFIIVGASGCRVARDGLIQTKNDLELALSQTSSYLEFEVSDVANENVVEGLGVEWDPHYYYNYYNQENGLNDQDLVLIKERAEILNIQKIRVWCMPNWYEPEKDVFDFDSETMLGLYSVLDAAEELGIDVNITLWGCQGWLAMENGYWMSPPNDLNTYAENVVTLVRYLTETKNYTCFKEMTFHNEPDWEFICDSTVEDSFQYYLDMCRTVHEKLVAENLRDRIELCLSGVQLENTGAFDRFATGVNAFADSFDIHSYNDGERSYFGEMKNRVKVLKTEYLDKLPNKVKFTASEFGSDVEIDSYERGILYSTMAEGFLSGGISSMLHWVFFDQDYGDSRMETGLFKYKDEGWEPRPFYHSWGLIMKYAVKGSEIYPFEDETNFVNGVALKSPEGKWTYFITNNAKRVNSVVKISNPHFEQTQMYAHEYNPDTVTTSAELIGSSGIAYSEGSDVYVRMNANTFVVLTEQE